MSQFTFSVNGSSDSDSSKSGVVRKRNGSSRSKTGCITCRIRHVKCDERRPACDRCTKTGRKCDGYQKSTWDVTDVSTMQTIITLSADPRTASDPHARRGFQVFEKLTTHNLAGLFESDLWQEVLRASQHNDALWQAATALGTAHEAFLQRRFDMETLEEDRALKQYNKAIRSLTKASSSGQPTPPEVMMVASILFMTFEILRREYGKAIKHIMAGIEIFAEHNKGQPNRIRSKLINTIRLESMLRNLETHLCELSMEDRFPLMPRTNCVERQALPQDQEGWVLPTEATHLPAFTSINEARLELDGLWHNLMFILHEMGEPLLFPPSTTPEQLMERCQIFRQAFVKWRLKFDKLVENLNRRPDSLKNVDRKALAQLEMYQITGEQILDPALTDELSWDGWTHGFERTLDLCDIIVGNSTSKEDNSAEHGGFSLDHGIVTACFHTVRKCRIARIRQRALDLLSKQRQDGLWDAQLVERVGRHIDNIERGPGLLADAVLRDAGAEEIPIWRRIQAIEVMFSSAGREAVVTFYVPKSEFDDDVVLIRKSLSW